MKSHIVCVTDAEEDIMETLVSVAERIHPWLWAWGAFGGVWLTSKDIGRASFLGLCIGSFIAVVKLSILTIGSA